LTHTAVTGAFITSDMKTTGKLSSWILSPWANCVLLCTTNEKRRFSGHRR